MSSPEVQCPRDPGNPAGAPCPRCGTFTCGVCASPWEGQWLCPDCVGRVARGDGSWLAVGAGILGFLSLACVPLALVAIVLAGIDLAKGASRGRAARRLDVVAILVALAALGFWGVFLFA
ncbi:hypothetical protein LZ198_15315 [Myxococcus sp. K15C18031901]|uniref:hypothetical protein n=1 Tax=Myxococcus dinghuensis TaxID=2906761 RepID=UPI0020A7F840|nr:hypothetical protein [Myxococcus dinghuensis]MCP3100238.1 hypothetical protein [Myxococcus dinghuensis]